MYKSYFKMVVTVSMFAMTACAGTSFTGGMSSSSSSKTAGAAGASGTTGVSQAGTATDTSEANEAGENEAGLTSQPTVPQFVALVDPASGDATTAEQVRRQDDCCLSNGNGHGIEVCMSGDKSAIASLVPIRIDGDQICVPEATILANQALFATGVMGRCNNQ